MVAIRRRREKGQDENQLEENDDDDDCLEYIYYDNLDVAYFDESSPKWHVSTNYALWNVFLNGAFGELEMRRLLYEKGGRNGLKRVKAMRFEDLYSKEFVKNAEIIIAVLDGTMSAALRIS
ncbi:hypothetical protein Tco_0389220 [Tanacetum coccineum]